MVRSRRSRRRARVANPLSTTTRDVLLGVAALGALGAIFYAVNKAA